MSVSKGIKNSQGGTLLLVIVVVLAVLTVSFGGLAIYYNFKYQSKSQDVNGQIDRAVLEAQSKQKDKDEKEFADRQNNDTKAFNGPKDYGALTFQYPKAWSAFVQTDYTRGGTYKAYLHPDVVPPISNQQQYALRVVIYDQDYDSVLARYDGLVKSGKLRRSSTNSQGHVGTRLDGNFSNDIRGAAVIYKSHDKTIILRTDATAYEKVFNQIIKTVSFDD